jgi:hypothetical protein
VGLWGVEIIEVGFASRRATPRTEMLTQLPAMVNVLKGVELGDLKGHETLVAALAGSMTLAAAPPSYEQQPPNGNSVLNGHESHDEVVGGIVHK